MDDYPNPGDNLNSEDMQGWTPQADEAKELDKAKQNAKIASSVGILQDFFTDIDADIEELRGTDRIQGVNPSTDAEELKLAILVNNMSRANLIELRDKYRVKYGQYLEERPID